MDHAYAKELEQKKSIYLNRTNTRKALFTTLITSFGAVKNPAYLSIIDNQVVLEQLFQGGVNLQIFPSNLVPNPEKAEV